MYLSLFVYFKDRLVTYVTLYGLGGLVAFLGKRGGLFGELK